MMFGFDKKKKTDTPMGVGFDMDLVSICMALLLYSTVHMH